MENSVNQMSPGTAVGIGIAALFGVGLIVAANNGGWFGNRCGNCCNNGMDPYLIGENNGKVKAGIECNREAIANVQNTLSQMQQNGYLGAAIAASNADIKANQNLCAAQLGGSLSSIQTTVQSALGNSFVWCKPICPATTTTAA